MHISVTLVQELPDGITKEQAEEWAEFEITGGSCDINNPLLGDHSLDLDTSKIDEWEIHE
jgi:hypothetical protein